VEVPSGVGEPEVYVPPDCGAGGEADWPPTSRVIALERARQARLEEGGLAIDEAMESAGLNCSVASDLRGRIWLKLVGNAAFNPLSVFTGATLAELCDHPATRALMRRMMRETLAVAAAYGSAPRIDVEGRIARARQFGEHKTSMLQDWETGKPLELAAIVTAVIERAEVAEVPVPQLEAIHAAVQLAEHRRTKPVSESHDRRAVGV
jgi:2-dehydropantoate 2-reductase